MEKGTEQGNVILGIILTVVIISILAIVLIGFFDVDRPGSDGPRISYLKQVQITLEQYYNNNGSYPITGWLGLVKALAGTNSSAKEIPTPPRGIYYYASDGKTYVLGVKLDDPQSPAFNASFRGELSTSTSKNGDVFMCQTSSIETNGTGIFCVGLHPYGEGPPTPREGPPMP